MADERSQSPSSLASECIASLATHVAAVEVVTRKRGRQQRTNACMGLAEHNYTGMYSRNSEATFTLGLLPTIARVVVLGRVMMSRWYEEVAVARGVQLH